MDRGRCAQHRRTTSQRGYGSRWQRQSRALRQQIGRCQRCGTPDDLTLDHVRAITCPVLVLRGEQSNILAADAAERFAAALPDGTLITVPECGHNVHSGNTLGFLDAITPFLDRLGAPSA